MLAPTTLAALPSTRAIPDRDVFYVADPISSIETRSLPTLTRSYPCRFTFYVADPISSIQLFAGDTPASTAVELMHRKRLMMHTRIGTQVCEISPENEPVSGPSLHYEV